MKKSEREYPVIDFIETDTETIESNMIALYEEFVKQSGRRDYKVYPASPERLFIAWCAAIIVQQRVLINETAKKNVPRYAKGEYLDSLAELFKDIERLPATPATAFLPVSSAVQEPSHAAGSAETSSAKDTKCANRNNHHHC